MVGFRRPRDFTSRGPNPTELLYYRGGEVGAVPGRHLVISDEEGVVVVVVAKKRLTNGGRF